jgi:hypothetical protein
MCVDLGADVRSTHEQGQGQGQGQERNSVPPRPSGEALWARTHAGNAGGKEGDLRPDDGEDLAKVVGRNHDGRLDARSCCLVPSTWC